MTEDEAKTKWCFHVIASHTDPRSPPSQYEREAGSASPFRHNCIGSACMAWRWGEERNPDWKPRHQMMSGYPEHPDDVSPTHLPSKTCGFCGLAGAPR